MTRKQNPDAFSFKNCTWQIYIAFPLSDIPCNNQNADLIQCISSEPGHGSAALTARKIMAIVL